MSGKKRSFVEAWLTDDRYKSWIRKIPTDNSRYYCSICNTNFLCSTPVSRHANSAYHKNNVDNDLRNNNNNNNNNNLVIEKFKIHISKRKRTNKSKSIKNLNTQTNKSLLTFDERKKEVEIRYAALITEKNIPHKSAQEILSFFQHVGKDPDILKSMSMGRTKCKNIITNVLCPIETERVVNKIQNTKFTIFIDETSDISNEK